MWALALAGIIALVGAMPTVRDLVPSQAAAATTVRVAADDTLWSIAAAHRLPGATTAETVEAIRSANGMTGSALHVGASLIVPHVTSPAHAFAQAEDSGASD